MQAGEETLWVFYRMLKFREARWWISHLRLMKVEDGLSLGHLAFMILGE
jgi:hypothetical protein